MMHFYVCMYIGVQVDAMSVDRGIQCNLPFLISTPERTLPESDSSDTEPNISDFCPTSESSQEQVLEKSLSCQCLICTFFVGHSVKMFQQTCQ